LFGLQVAIFQIIKSQAASSLPVSQSFDLKNLPELGDSTYFCARLNKQPFV
jgi:hypothetical protein